MPLTSSDIEEPAKKPADETSSDKEESNAARNNEDDGADKSEN